MAATVLVMVLPAFAVSSIDTAGRLWLVIGTVLLAMLLSLTAAAVGSAIWMRRPGSRDLVFGDLMLWGWLRRARAERRLAESWELLQGLTSTGGAQNGAVSRERRAEILQQLSDALEARDAYTHGHTRRVTRHAERIAGEMGLSPEQVAQVRLAAAVHDVGKIHTPREVLNKPGRLDDEEFAVIKRHPVDGAEMVAAIGDPEITAMVRHHHERLDGTGYPDGLSGTDVPLGARIIAVADTFDAMTSSRPYRAASKHKKAIDVLAKEAGTQLDPAAVNAFRRYYTAKRSVAVSAFVVTAPRWVGTWAGGLFQGGGASSLAQGLAAMGATALAGAALGGQAASASEERDARADGPVHHGKPSQDERRGQAKSGSARERQERSDRRPGGAARPGKKGLAKGPSRRGGADGGKSPGAPGGGSAMPGNGSGGPEDGSGRPGGGPGGPGGGSPAGPGPSRPPVRLPDVRVPDVKVPGVKVPDVRVPDVEVPDVKVPDVKVPDVQVPDVKVPDVRVPGSNLPRLP